MNRCPRAFSERRYMLSNLSTSRPLRRPGYRRLSGPDQPMSLPVTDHQPGAELAVVTPHPSPASPMKGSVTVFKQPWRIEYSRLIGSCVVRAARCSACSSSPPYPRRIHVTPTPSAIIPLDRGGVKRRLHEATHALRPANRMLQYWREHTDENDVMVGRMMTGDTTCLS